MLHFRPVHSVGFHGEGVYRRPGGVLRRPPLYRIEYYRLLSELWTGDATWATVCDRRVRRYGLLA
jgi:hypothetical protein